jgi:hypothetical protein
VYTTGQAGANFIPLQPPGGSGPIQKDCPKLFAGQSFGMIKTNFSEIKDP